jgi:hypothetical protein
MRCTQYTYRVSLCRGVTHAAHGDEEDPHARPRPRALPDPPRVQHGLRPPELEAYGARSGQALRLRERSVCAAFVPLLTDSQ